MRRLWLLAGVSALAMVAFAQGDHVPAYNTAPPKAGELMPILPADQRVGEMFSNPYQVHAYELAAKIPGVLNQLPCYCYCERIGHKSLHTCYRERSRSPLRYLHERGVLRVRADEAKKTPTQIRAGIIKGDWKSIDLDAAAKVD